MPTIGDPGPTGWITVAAYFTAALCSLAAAGFRSASEPVRLSDRRFWLMVCVAMTALGINKQLDLQTLLTQVGRSVALSEGVFSIRRQLQAMFIALCAVVGSLMAFWIGWRHRKRPAPIRWAGLGLVWIIAFVVVRAASFHHVDVAIGREFMGVPVNALLELPGILVVTLAALAYRFEGSG